MRYVNSKLCALLALGVSLVAVPGLRAQVAPAPLRGDVDGDGRVTRADADAVRAYLVRGTLPGGRSILPAGDANGDGRVTAADAALISRFAAGVDVSRFPVGRPVENGRGEAGGGTLQSGDQFCTADVQEKTITCREVLEGGAGSQNVILGTPYVTFVTSTTYSDDNTGEDTANYTVRIGNATPQPLGTTDGTTLAAGGIRLFFKDGPTVVTSTGGAASIRLETPDGTATFTNQNGSSTFTDRAYFQYNEVLAPADTTDPRSMQFIYSSNVTRFSFVYRVSAAAPYEHGWITIAPASLPILAPGETASLTGTVYNQVGQVQADGITWSSSNTAAATVNASTGEVTAVDTGTATITATSTVNAQRTGSRNVIVDRFPTVSSTTPANSATAVLVTDSIVINFSEAVNVTGSAFTLECPVGSSQAFTVSGNGTSTITLNPNADLPAATSCTVVVDGNEVTDVDTNDGPDMMPANYTFSFETAIQAFNDAFGTTTTGNVRINSANTDPVFSVTTNDKITGTTTITFAGWAGNAGKTLGGGDVVMTMSGAGMGQFTYNPPAGFEGTDSLEYVIQSGTFADSGKVSLPVSGMIWFVNNAGAACTTRASGCGRLTNPYSSLAAFNAENNGTGNNPGAGDNIFVYESATTYTGPVTLLANQKLIGQDAGATLSTITGITPATGSDPLPGMNPGANSATIAGTSGGVVLGVDNLLRGFSIATTGGTALSGTGFGTPTIAEVPVSATAGAALSLDNGTLNSTFPSVSSTNSTGRGISLSNVNGTPTFTAGSISGAVQAAMLVSGGNVGFTFPGNIGQANNAPLLDVQGSHNGTLVFSGALSATNGTGLQFNAAQGTYTFSGTTTLNGGDAGVDITNGSGGTFNFNASTQITNPSGTGLNVYGSAPTLVSYAGSITKNGTNPGRLVEIGEMTGGTVTFPVGSTLSSTSTAAAATGISLSNVDGTVNFNGTTTLNGGDAGVDVLAGTGGTIVFSANTSITNPSGTALNVNASTPNLTYNGNLTKNGTSAGRLVDVTGQTGGGTVAANNTITFQNGTLSSTTSAGTGILLSDVDGTVNFNGTTTLNGGDAGVDVEGGSGGVIAFASGASITNSNNELIRVVSSAPTFTYAGSFNRSSGAGAGILAQNNTGGTLTFSGATQTLNTGASAAVSLLSNTGATINFTGGALAITTAGGAGFAATGGGTVNVTGTTNTVVSGTGTAVNIANTTIGGSGVTFRSVSASSATNGIVLNTTGAGSFTVAGNGGSCTIATPTCTGGLITGTTGAGVSLNATGPVSLTRLRVQSAQSHGITASGSTNLTLTSSYLQSNGNGDEENGLNLLNASGTVLVDASSFNGAAENLIRVDNNNANLTFTVQGASVFEFPNPEPSAFRNSAILITPKGSSAITATVTGNTFRNIPVSSFQAAPDASVTSTSTYTFTNNTLSADVGLNVLCSSNAQCRVGNVVAGGTGGITNFVATGNTFNRVNGDGVMILGANQSSTLRARIESNSISNALDDAFVLGLGQSARVIAQFNSNTISNIGADVLEVASGESNAAFGAGAASDMDLVFTNNSMNTVGTNSSFAATGGPGVFRFGDADQLLCLAFTGNSMSGPLPTTGLKVYLDGNFGALGGSMTYEGAGVGALTDAKIQADNPGMSLAPANTVINAVNLSNGATCQRPGI
jgi:hypothetical protein